MIFGIGIDVVEVSRVERLLERYGERFAARTLPPTTIRSAAFSVACWTGPIP